MAYGGLDQATWDAIAQIAEIKETYPQYAPLLEIPEVGKILLEAVKGDWSAARLQGAIYETHWYQTTPDAARQLIILEIQDPATFDQNVRNQAQALSAQAKALGVQNADWRQLKGLAEKGMKKGWSEQQYQQKLVQKTITWDPDEDYLGQMGAAISSVKARAADYVVPVSDRNAFEFAKQLVAGTVDETWADEYFKEQARSLFPALGDALDRGLTVRQYAEPYVQVAAQELEIHPEDINFLDQKWGRALTQMSPDNKPVSMSLSDWQRTLRTEDVYGFDRTTKAKQQSAELQGQLLKTFGAL